MRQLLYVSSSTKRAIGDALATILVASRKNNTINNLTGLLWTDGTRFLQVLEGEHERVEETFARIRADDRHHAVVILQDRPIDERTFGLWSMALLSDRDEQIAQALATADPQIRGTFEGFIATRRAA